MDVAESLLLDNEPFDVSRAAAWLDNLLQGAGLPPRVIAALQVVLDEVLNNILAHGYADLENHKIELRTTADSAAVTLEFFDDGIPFDPTQHQSPPSTGANAKAAPGGLGLLFVRRLMDEVTYERADDRNHLTLRKFLAL
jgi:anti-sigma regulatory factor (Ser/Thr protein kinase)